MVVELVHAHVLTDRQTNDELDVRGSVHQQPSTYAKPEAASEVLGSCWWAVCRPKHVELHINVKWKSLIHCCILLDFLCERESPLLRPVHVTASVGYLPKFFFLKWTSLLLKSIRPSPYLPRRRATDSQLVKCFCMYYLCRLCCSVYSLCVDVFCITTTGCQRNCS